MNSSIDQLADRLRELPLDVPRPDVITARVLTGAARPAPARPPGFLAVAAAVFGLGLGVLGRPYCSPPPAGAPRRGARRASFSRHLLHPYPPRAPNLHTLNHL